jgi:crotonobetainyl-CoA:carnitine CoA-transferase CaiB-like acyl-CoA transferase
MIIHEINHFHLGTAPDSLGSAKDSKRKTFMAKVLDGVRVVEQGTFITGPAAGMLLADLGADVVKVEQPGTGDPFRAFKGGLYSPHYQTYNRNKRSIELDTRKADDMQVFDDLIKDADVYIQNFRPGTAERLGAGEARLRALNPRLVYCAISGFGQTGPAAGRPAYDTVAQAASGFLNLLVNPANPRVVGPAIADALTGFYAAYGILGALVERARTGAGRRVEVSMLEAMCHFNLDAFTHFFAQGEIMGPYSRPSVSQSYALACADGKKLALHMSSPEKFWRGLAKAMERPDILQDERFSTREGRIANQDQLIDILGEVFARRTRDEWCRRLAAEDVPHAPMYDTAEALQDPQAVHLQLEIEGTHPTLGPWRTVRSPVSFDGERATTVTPPPLLGEHNAQIRAALKRGANPGETEDQS